MQVDSGPFFLFLGLVWVVWRIFPKVAAPAVLLAASLLFYASSNLRHLGLMALLAAANYASVQKLSAWEDGRKRTLVFSFAVTLDVAALVFYKWASAYLNLESLPRALGGLLPVTNANRLLFPLGLSFFIFQMVACVTDVYRRNYRWSSGAGSFFLFAFFFPQISAGPIPRAGALVPQLTRPRGPVSGDLEAGVSLLAYGLFKKLVVANRLQEYARLVFSTHQRISTVPVLLACICSALSLYADFSGYTDLARGAARVFGIHLAENFNRPFQAESMTEFWRRWHMSLSNWLKDYLYLPLVIRLRSLGKTAFALSFLLTFLICGLWHGISWPFAIFGLMHGSALSVEFLTRKSWSSWIRKQPWLGSRWMGRAYVFSFFVMANVMFRAGSVSQAWQLYAKILVPSRLSGLSELVGYDRALQFFLVFTALALWGLVAALRPKWEEHRCARFVLLCAVVTLSLGRLGEGGFVYVAF